MSRPTFRREDGPPLGKLPKVIFKMQMAWWKARTSDAYRDKLVKELEDQCHEVLERITGYEVHYE